MQATCTESDVMFMERLTKERHVLLSLLMARYKPYYDPMDTAAQLAISIVDEQEQIWENIQDCENESSMDAEEWLDSLQKPDDDELEQCDAFLGHCA